MLSKYKLMHWLFGWDYVSYKLEYFESRVIARVHAYPGNVVGVYKGTVFAPETKNAFVEIKNLRSVIWLTCCPTKYITPNTGDKILDWIERLIIKEKNHLKTLLLKYPRETVQLGYLDIYLLNLKMYRGYKRKYLSRIQDSAK